MEDTPMATCEGSDGGVPVRLSRGVARRLRSSPLEFARLSRAGFDLERFPYVRRVFEDRAPVVYLRWGRGMGKTSTVMDIVLHGLVTRPGFQVMGTAARDWQAWRLTKEFIRPRLKASLFRPLMDLAEVDRVSEILFPHGSRWLARGAWATGDSLRGPHVNMGVADEIQDWTREAWTVLLEVVSLPPGRIYAMGTGCQAGTLSEELWNTSDQKEWNGREWVPQNPDWDGRVSGYHVTQEYSPWVSKQELEWKRKNYTERMWVTEVLADFWQGDVRPIPLGVLTGLVEDAIPAWSDSRNVSIGVDWGNESRWVAVIRTPSGDDGYAFWVADTGIWDAIRVSDQVEQARSQIQMWRPGFVVCDTGYGRSQIQELSRLYPGLVWGVVSNRRTAVYPEWRVEREAGGRRLAREDWVYTVSVDHSSMCENLEHLLLRRRVRFNRHATGLDSLFLEMVEAETQTSGGERRWNITRAHGFAALAYALLPWMAQPRVPRPPASR